MSRIVLDAIAAEVAKVVRVVDAPLAPLGYGTDLSCTDDLAPSMQETTGDQQSIAEAIVRRYQTPRGSLPDVSAPQLRDMTYGLDLATYLHRGLTREDVEQLAANVRSEAKKDPRVATVKATVTPTPTGSSLAIDLRVTPKDPSIGPFELVLAVTSAGVLIDELRSVQ